MNSSSSAHPQIQSSLKSWQAGFWLTLGALAGVAIIFLYRDSYQQDAGVHYLFARWAGKHWMHFVSVWGRPLFTTLYFLPARLGGYTAARLFTVFICVVMAWQTWRLAQQLGCKRAELTIPFLFLQPSFLLLSADVMTEPLHALALVIALRLHLGGYVKSGMVVASLLPLFRPEGFFIVALWGLWILFDRRVAASFFERIPRSAFLASGIFIWWFSAIWIMNDPLWIWRNWPQDWHPEGGQYGSADIWWYIHKSSYIFGLVLKAPFVIGLLWLLWTRRFLHGVAVFALIFALHSVMFVRGSFGAAGYPRYFVCVAPTIAIITLAGWNNFADVCEQWLKKFSPLLTAPVLAGLLLVSGVHSWHYLDGWGFARDGRAIDDMRVWFNQNAAATHPVKMFYWSHVYMCVAFDRDLWEMPGFSGDREHNLEVLRYAPPGSLVFWDNKVGAERYKLTADDIQATGFTKLRSQAYQLDGRFFSAKWNDHGGVWDNEFHLLYKLPETSSTTVVQNRNRQP